MELSRFYHSALQISDEDSTCQQCEIASSPAKEGSGKFGCRTAAGTASSYKMDSFRVGPHLCVVER